MDGKFYLFYFIFLQAILLTHFYGKAVARPMENNNRSRDEAQSRWQNDSSSCGSDYTMEDVADDPDICQPWYYYPLCVMSGAVDSSRGRNEISVAIHIPSCTTKKELSVPVGPSHNTLDIYFTWPQVVTDVNVLHKYWLKSSGQNKIEPYPSRVVGFRNLLRSYCARESDSIVTTSRLRLTCKVETKVVKKRLKWTNEEFHCIVSFTSRCNVPRTRTLIKVMPRRSKRTLY